MKREKYMIGDYVLNESVSPNYRYRIVSFLKDGISATLAGNDSNYIPYRNVKPIQLTADELVKLGFVKESEMYHIEVCEKDEIVNKKELRLDIDDDEYFADIVEYDNGLESEQYSINIAKITYTHQLQQLYYTLTQTELKYKS